jgi:CubicO group peptidase (beta-lactamase class C family)
MNINREVSLYRPAIRDMMKKGKIPGLSIVIIDGDNPPFIKNFGYAHLEKKIPVHSDTLFQLASCSKSFTALAALKLEEQGLIDLDSPAATYLPWFRSRFRRYKIQDITLRQLLHHSSGIAWTTICNIPRGDSDDMLEQTVRNIRSAPLKHPPGRRFMYATVNYDIIGAVIEVVTGLSFEQYMEREIFQPLGLHHTVVGVNTESPEKAAGYKSGVLGPSRYDAPVFRGNNPAGYILSTPEDIARWLKLQLGLVDTPMKPLIEKTHVPDESVPTYWFTRSYYGMGWFVQRDKKDPLYHEGLNPNFTCKFWLRLGKKRAVAVLSNAGSMTTFSIANFVTWFLFNEKERGRMYLPGFQYTGFSWFMAVLCCLFLVGAAGSVILKVQALLSGMSRFLPVTVETLTRAARTGLAIAAVLAVGRYAPRLKWKYYWETLIVWKPRIFLIALRLFLASVGTGFLLYLLNLFTW